MLKSFFSDAFSPEDERISWGTLVEIMERERSAELEHLHLTQREKVHPFAVAKMTLRASTPQEIEHGGKLTVGPSR